MKLEILSGKKIRRILAANGGIDGREAAADICRAAGAPVTPATIAAVQTPGMHHEARFTPLVLAGYRLRDIMDRAKARTTGAGEDLWDYWEFREAEQREMAATARERGEVTA